MSTSLAALMAGEKHRRFDARASLTDGMLTIHLSVDETDRWLKVYEPEWDAITAAVHAARTGTELPSKPECVKCGLRIRPEGQQWRHWTTTAGRKADANHQAVPAGEL